MRIATVDVGSSSMRMMLFDKTGKVVTAKLRTYSMQRAEGGAVEMDPILFRSALQDLTRSVVGPVTEMGEADAEDRAGYAVDAIVLTAQRSSVIAVDEAGNPLRSVLMWHDRRSVDLCAQFQATAGQRIYDICAMPPTPVFSAPKMAWLRDNEPDNYHAAHKLVGIHDFLLHEITGEWITDTSLASRTCLFDIRRLEWSSELLDIFGLDAAKLCRVVPVGSVCGRVSAAFAKDTGLPEGVPVITAGGDQQCAALGMGLVSAEEAVINSGSGSYVLALSPHPVFDPAQKLVCNVSAIPGQWILEGGMLSSGLVFGWFNEILYGCPCSPSSPLDYDRINADCAISPPGARGLLMSPCLNGKGAPLWDSHARGLFHNVSFETRREDFARAVLEGVASELRDCVTAVATLKGLERFPVVTCSGGLTRSDIFNQILCDTLNTPLQLAAGVNATARGAWVSAAVALGLYPDASTALAAARSTDTASAPDVRLTPDAACHELYRRSSKARAYLYESVDMRRLNSILREPAEGACCS